MGIDGFAMKQHPNHALHIAAVHHGFTLLELTVALVVFSVALTGLMPLIAILSRDLQPPVGQKGKSPARDWNKSDCDVTNHRPTTWYLTAYDDPWVRKLGSAAKVSADSPASSTPVPLQPPVTIQDDDGTTGDADGDGNEDYSEEEGTPWTYDDTTSPLAYGSDQHRKTAQPAGSTSTGAAVWKFTIHTAGYYSIQATWTAAADQVNDAQYTVKKNFVLQPTITVNQSAAPVGVVDSNNRSWQSLTSSLMQLAANDVVEVQLSDVRASSTETGKYVVADAVRIVQNKVRLDSMERSLSGTNTNSNNADATAIVTVTVNIPK